tara:strand:+ start:283 stop:846 length:564 start_codon:yes stop_codon:yes gene_type:complete
MPYPKYLFYIIALGLIISCNRSQEQYNPELDPNAEIHRLQDTTVDQSGWYYAKSMQGNFSVLMPIPFNDYTVKVNDYESFYITGESDEGVTFTILQAENLKDAPVNLNQLISKLDKPTTPVSQVAHYSQNNYTAVSFHQTSFRTAAFGKYALHGNSMYTLMIQFPFANEDLVKSIKDPFFDYLVIED